MPCIFSSSLHLRIHALTVDKKLSSITLLLSRTACRIACALAADNGTMNSPSSSAAVFKMPCKSSLAESTLSSVRCTITSSVFTRFSASADSDLWE